MIKYIVFVGVIAFATYEIITFVKFLKEKKQEKENFKKGGNDK